MKPAIKPKRTAEEQAEEDAIRRQHAANPVRQVPDGTIDQRSFAAILTLLARFKSARERQGLTLADVAQRMGIDPPRAVSPRNRKSAEPDFGDTAQMGGSVGAETGDCVIRLLSRAAAFCVPLTRLRDSKN